MTVRDENGYYLDLVQMLPLKRIRTGTEHARALKMSGSLIGFVRKLTVGQSQYLDALVVLIREFEQSHADLELPRSIGIGVLKHLMAENGMTQRQLAEQLGIGESAASMILAESRKLTKSRIEALSRRFGVGVGVFFG